MRIGNLHAITGLKCGDKFYIYDSNNVICYDEWNNSNFDNYFKTINIKFKNSFYSTIKKEDIKISFLCYINSSIQ
jgi:hypothetical protein